MQIEPRLLRLTKTFILLYDGENDIFETHEIPLLTPRPDMFCLMKIIESTFCSIKHRLSV